MKSKVANGKFNIFLGKVFLDNLFEYIPFTQATKENVRFYKEILKITPSFVSLLTARNGVVYVYTAFGYFIVKLYHNIYGEQIAIILDVVFSHPYNLIYGAIGGSQFIEMGASYLISVATVAVTVVNMII